MSVLLSQALRYLERGLSIIPIRPRDKKPLIAWERYQKERANEEQVERWLAQWPDANVGIVTGAVSGVDVIDVDSSKGAQALTEYLPETFETPTCQTPRGGSHIYVAHRDVLGNAVRFIEDCDYRGQGGFVVAPPSIGKNGRPYSWAPYLSIFDATPAALPEPIYYLLKNAFGGSMRGVHPNRNKAQQSATNATLNFEQGHRDDTLFHIAHSLIKGGMTPDNALICLKVIALQCNPPFPEKEVQAKIESVLKRISTKERNLTAEIREIISATWGNISATFIYESATIATSEDKHKARTILGRLVQEGLLERVPGKNGWYRRVETECEEINFLDAETESVNIVLPFGIHNMIEVMPGNIILIAGEPNSGKTALFLNIIYNNMHSQEVHYFNSEMGSGELKKRLSKFENLSLKDWKFKAYERSGNFGDVIKPGNGKVNIIDYLEIHENFYEIGGKLAEIHQKLNGAIAIVALQKNRGTDMGLGGFRTLEKPRLALAMEPGTLKIVKAKNWKTSDNPNGKQIDFKIINGCTFIPTGGWKR